MSLALPPPTNGAAEESLTLELPAAKTDDFLAGLILPPPEIRSIVDKTAAFVAKNPKPELFEDKIRLREKSDSRFAFLNKTDAYHAYYQHRLEAFRAGEVAEVKPAPSAQQPGAADEEQDEKPVEPPQLEFLVDTPPTINAVDLDILRLTALFTARSGRQFISELSNREARNYQFDFLRPSHSLFGYFNRLVEQYTKILIPSKESTARLERRSGGSHREGEERDVEGRREVLKDTKLRVEWESWESGRQKELEDKQEAERIAFAEIDWQDFVVVSTVEFTEGDEAGLVELPPPMSISEVENMTIAQKKMAAMIMEGREDEVEQNERERRAGEGEMDEDVEVVVTEEVRVEKERRKAVEIKTADSNAPMKIRKDYVPKANRPAQAAQALTEFGGQQVPVEDFAEHLRIELLDPRWKEKKRQIDANRSASNLLPGGTDVSASLRALAANRADIFGAGQEDEVRKKAEAALKLQQKERERNVWDGHTASADTVTDRAQAGANFDEQIAAIHRAKGLVSLEDGGDPRIGPSFNTPSAPIEQPTFISGATFSAAPQPNQTNHSLPSYSQAGGYGQPLNQPQAAQPDYSTQDYGSAGLPTPMAGLPARPPVANPGEALPAGAYGATLGRSAEDGPDGEPTAKKQRRSEGIYYPEEDWISSHPNPISLTVQLPEVSDKPAWGCNGQEIVLENIPLTLLVGTIRDRISAKIGLPIGKQRLSFGGNLLSMTITLASLNVENRDVISVSIKDGKKK